MRGLGPDFVYLVGPTGVELFDFLYSGIQLYNYTVESLSLFYLLFISRLVFNRRCYIDKLGNFHQDQTSIRLDSHLKQG